MREAIADVLPENYEARIGERFNLIEQSPLTYIQIFHRPERRLVTVLELLSPSNKNGPDRSVYLAKRNSLLRQDVHLFELDLLFGGKRLPLSGDLPSGDYYALVSRSDRRPQCEVYAWSVRQPLPKLPIPLRASDPDVIVDLAAIFATAYERGRYARSIDYSRLPALSVDEETAKSIWQEAQGGPKG